MIGMYIIQEQVGKYNKLTTDIIEELPEQIACPLSCSTIQDVFTIREVIESLAVRIATAQISNKQLDEVYKNLKMQEMALQDKNLTFFLKADWEFHWSIYKHCGNEILLGIIEHLWARIDQARNVAKSNKLWGSIWSEKSVSRHRALYEAIVARETKIASKITEKNIRSASKELIDQIRAQGWDNGL